MGVTQAPCCGPGTTLDPVGGEPAAALDRVLIDPIDEIGVRGRSYGEWGEIFVNAHLFIASNFLPPHTPYVYDKWPGKTPSHEATIQAD